MRSLSKKTRYAFHGLAYIAAFSDGKPVPFDEILAYLRAYAQKLTLSPGYIVGWSQRRLFRSRARARAGVGARHPAATFDLLGQDLDYVHPSSPGQAAANDEVKAACRPGGSTPTCWPF